MLRTISPGRIGREEEKAYASRRALEPVTWFEAVVITGAGVCAGIVNTIVGSGSLITFPTLLAFGYPPVIANVTNGVGLAPGSVSGAVGYRRETAAAQMRVWPLSIVAGVGAVAGGALLLLLPPGSFEVVVPWLVLLACLLMAFQPRLSRRLAGSREGVGGGPGLFISVFFSSVYGGYFGAAQGVILIALLAIFVADDLQRLNGVKNVLQSVVNCTAAVLFVFYAPVRWLPAILLAGGAIVGGQLGAVIGRRLPPDALRYTVVVVGILVAVKLFLDQY